MALRHSAVIEVKRIQGKGRGVFARCFIRQCEVIEWVPVLVLPSEEVKEPEKWAGLASYCFELGDGRLALALGYGSLYNHSYQPNARYCYQNGQTMVFTAIRDIAPGDEFTVNYNAEPLDQSPLGFTVIVNEASKQQAQCPETKSRRNNKTANGQPHRNLSLVDLDLPAKGEPKCVQ
jgi:SET domain-containing protein